MNLYDAVSSIKNVIVRRFALVAFTVVVVSWYVFVITVYTLIEALKTLLTEWEAKYKNDYYNFTEWFFAAWKDEASK